MRTHAKDVKPGSAQVAGWCEEIRVLGGLTFIKLRDASGFVQITVPKKKVSEDVLEAVKQLTKESVIAVHGEAVANKEAPGGIEVIPKSIELLSKAEPVAIDFSGKAKTTFDNRLDYRSLDLRNPKNLAIFKVQSVLLSGFREYLDKHGFMQVFTPCIMGVASESGSEVFPLEYYKTKAFLRQDPQLHRQLTIAGGLEKIYEIGPSWRAELSHTTSHLSEHRVIAAEVAFIESEYDIIKLEEAAVLHALKKVKDECKEELELFGVKLELPEKIPILEFPDIYEILEKGGRKIPYGEDYDRECEELLWNHIKKHHGCDLFFVNKFPFAVKPFYVMVDEHDGKRTQWARSVDLVFRGVELSSGGQREHRYEHILENIKEKKMSPKSVEWFTKFFKYGVPPHGGFAIGIERLTKQLLNIENIRECTLFPRDVERLVP